jgi:hypothetical protein
VSIDRKTLRALAMDPHQTCMACGETGPIGMWIHWESAGWQPLCEECKQVVIVTSHEQLHKIQGDKCRWLDG